MQTNPHFEMQFIDGAWRAPEGGFIPVENPATRALFARIPDGTAGEVDRAVRAARAALPAWSAVPLARRIELMETMLEHFRAKSDAIVALEVAELGSPVTFARKKHCEYQLKRTAAFIHAARQIELESNYPASIVTLEPVGVVGAITPWNYPLGQIIQKVVPALLMGCTVVLKPSELTPLTAVMLVEAFDEAGFPAGVLNLVQGYGQTVGEAITGHPGIDMVSFTGSTEVGSRIALRAAPEMKRLALELGGKSAAIWLPGLDDYRVPVRKVLESLLLNAGQTCTALSRLLVPRDMLGTAERLILAHLKDYPAGDPFEPAVRIGPLVSRAQYETVRGYIASGVAEGARLIAGGIPAEPGPDTRGWYVAPTVFSDVRPDMKIAREEIFGPVLSILTFETEDEALALANDTPYGLNAMVVGPRERAEAFARGIRAGNVYVNDAPRDVTAPFGGYGASGIGREGGRYGLMEFTQLKAVFDRSTF